MLLDLPLFPSYVFVRPRLDQRLRMLQAPGLLWLVHDRSGPVRMDAEELDAIRVLLASGLEYDPLPELALGDEAEITRGALRGCHGRLLRKQPGAIVLMVSAVGGAVRVRLDDCSWVTTARRPTRRTPLGTNLPAGA